MHPTRREGWLQKGKCLELFPCLFYFCYLLVFSCHLVLIFLEFVVFLILIWFAMFTELTKIICWNCRGVSSRDATSRIFYLMKKFNLIMLCLVETRANDNRLQRFCSKLKSQWKWAAILAEGYFGGIITIWNCKIGYVTPLIRSRFALHLVVTSVQS